jgi:ABC-type transport system involved in cytochrome bd biosynthesis fused ATPase/permease subunit
MSLVYRQFDLANPANNRALFGARLLDYVRALLRQPRVLTFDEATSNLDPTTAEAFARTVNQLRGKATILFIAHHVPKGLQVDRIARFGGADAVAPRSEPLSKGDAK